MQFVLNRILHFNQHLCIQSKIRNPKSKIARHEQDKSSGRNRRR